LDTLRTKQTTLPKKKKKLDEHFKVK